MSVPPSNPLPPGGYYVQPPPRPANSNSGCLKAFGITCGVLVLLAIIGGVLLYKAGAPLFQQAMGIGQDNLRGKQIQQAVVAYHQKNGKYPPNLTTLVGDGEITDGKILHSTQDPNPNPGHISWRYTPPPEGAPGDTPILSLPYSITVVNQTQRAELGINLDGSTSRTQNTAPVPSPSGGT